MCRLKPLCTRVQHAKQDSEHFLLYTWEKATPNSVEERMRQRDGW